MAHRYFCSSCNREWLFARGWALGEPCPACQADGTSVDFVTFRPEAPGLDIPRVFTPPAEEVQMPLDFSNYVSPPPVTLLEPESEINLAYLFI